MPGGVSAADRLRSEVPEGPAAGHETQTRTISFHGCVASPVGCAGPVSRGGDSTASVPTLLMLLSLPSQKHYQKNNAFDKDKEKRAGTRSLHAINIHPVSKFVKKESTKKVDFS